MERTTLSFETESLLRTDYTVVLNLDVMNGRSDYSEHLEYCNDTIESFKISLRNDNYYIVKYLFVINNPKTFL